MGLDEARAMLDGLDDDELVARTLDAIRLHDGTRGADNGVALLMAAIHDRGLRDRIPVDSGTVIDLVLRQFGGR